MAVRRLCVPAASQTFAGAKGFRSRGHRAPHCAMPERRHVRSIPSWVAWGAARWFVQAGAASRFGSIQGLHKRPWAKSITGSLQRRLAGAGGRQLHGKAERFCFPGLLSLSSLARFFIIAVASGCSCCSSYRCSPCCCWCVGSRVSRRGDAGAAVTQCCAPGEGHPFGAHSPRALRACRCG